MSIDTKELRTRIELQRSRLLRFELLIRDAPLDPHDGEPTTKVITMNSDAQRLRDEIRINSLLLMTEEKRRLLTAVIELIALYIVRSHQQKTIFISTILQEFLLLVELQKRINSAETIEELDKIGEELVEFKKEHPELENN